MLTIRIFSISAATICLLLYRQCGNKRSLLSFMQAICVCLLPFLLYVKYDSSLGRLHIWSLSFQLWLKQSFLIGLGAGQYNSAYNHLQAQYFSSRSLYTKEAMLANDGYFASNEYLQFGIDYGWWYSLLLLFLFGVYAYFLWAAWQQKLNGAQLSYTCLMLPFFIASWVAHPWHHYAAIAITVLFVLLLLAEELSKYPLANSLFKKWSYGIITVIIYLYAVVSFRSAERKEEILTMAKTEWQWGNKQYAIQCLDSICSKHPDWQPHNETLAYYHWVTGHTQKGIEILQRHHQYHCNQRFHQMLGDFYSELKQPALALHHYHTSLFINPHLIEPRIKLAETYNSLNNKDSAKYWAKEVLCFPRKVMNPKVKLYEKRARQVLSLMHQ